MPSYPSQDPMIPTGDREVHVPRLSPLKRPVPTLFRPIPYRPPAVAKGGVDCGFGLEYSFQAGDFDQSCQVVREAIRGGFLVGEIMPPRQLGDARLQAALDDIAGEVVRP